MDSATDHQEEVCQRMSLINFYAVTNVEELKALSKTTIRRMSQLIMKISSANTGQPKVAYGTGGPSSFLKKKPMIDS